MKCFWLSDGFSYKFHFSDILIVLLLEYRFFKLWFNFTKCIRLFSHLLLLFVYFRQVASDSNRKRLDTWAFMQMDGDI